ncbi:MAG TPA: alpha/beta hydrolase [Acidimicrobiales bacterium]|nr:alpha/beta hydrolase [Acidimicrobiales bacterium]
MSVKDFDPELRLLARVLPRAVIGPRTLPVLRRADARVRGRTCAGVETTTDGDLSFRLHRPATEPRGALLWMHGGGFVMGTAAQDDAFCRVIAARLGLLVAAVDYRLAPEHPFPVPLQDCHDALEWLAKRDDVDADRIAIGGASAGGALAAALALLARDRGVVRPVFQLLSYPMLDDRVAARADVDDRDARLWSNRSNRFAWSAYLGTDPGSPSVNGLAAPARHPDLGGVAPAWIGVGSLDILREEDCTYAARLNTAGVKCEVLVVDGAFHGFDSVSPRSAITQRFRDAQARALQKAFDDASAA